MGDLEEAERYLREAVENDKDNSVIWEHLGDLARKLGRTEEAIRDWKRSLELDPSNEDLRRKIEEIEGTK